MGAEKEKYRAWMVEQARDQGLLFTRVYGTDDISGTKIRCADTLPDLSEETYRELNEMNDAVARGDFRVLTDEDLRALDAPGAVP